MNSIFFSIVTNVIFIALFKEGVLFEFVQEENSLLHSENFVAKLSQLLGRAELGLRDLDTVFFLSGPGSQTGERVAFSFVTALELLNPQVQLLTLDSLTFQAGSLASCLSVITVGKNSKKYYLNCYQEGFLSLAVSRIGDAEFTELVDRFKSLNLLIDYEEVNFLACFTSTISKFKKFEGIKN